MIDKVRVKLYEIVYNEVFNLFQIHKAHICDPGYILKNIKNYFIYLDLIKYFARREVKKILDIGCGSGILCILLALNDYEVTGIDISDKMLRLAMTLNKKINLRVPPNFIKMNAVELVFPEEYFDCVISLHMIEHLHPKDVCRHILEVRRVLKTGGLYIISTPNRFSGHSIPLHLREYSYCELASLLSSVGFRVVSFVTLPRIKNHYLYQYG